MHTTKTESQIKERNKKEEAQDERKWLQPQSKYADEKEGKKQATYLRNNFNANTR